MESSQVALYATAVFLLAFAMMTNMVNADIALPTITINVTYGNGSLINGAFDSAILTCRSSGFNNTYGAPIPQLNISYYDSARSCYWAYDSNARGGMCNDSACTFYYFPQSTFRAAFYLPGQNKTFITNQTDAIRYTSYSMPSYSAKLYENGSATIHATSIPQPPTPPDLVIVLAALVLTITIEVIVALLYLSLTKVKNKSKILLTVVLVNIISVPIVWFGFIYFLNVAGFFLGEIFAVLFEGYVIYYLNRKMIKLGSALLMSLIMNISSLVIGVLALGLLIGWV